MLLEDFRGKVVMISGGSRGIGRATARAFARAGASVAIAARTADDVARTVAELHDLAAQAGAGGRAVGVAVDLAERAGVDQFVEQALATFGGVDVLVNNAGAAQSAPFLELTDEQLLSAWTLKLLGAIRLTRALVPVMEQRGGGAIVNIGGMAGREPAPDAVAVGTTNAAMRAFTKAISHDLARRGIRINLIMPGPVRTDRFARRVQEQAAARGLPIDAVLAEQQAEIPIGRFTEPEEVAELALLLASGRLPTLTGAEIVLDGGRSHGF